MDLNRIDQREAISPTRAWGGKVGNPEDPRLRAAAQQFEGMLLGIMLKESLSEKISEPDGDAAAGFDQFREFCVEQVATSLSESASMGIADQLYEQMSQQGISK